MDQFEEFYDQLANKKQKTTVNWISNEYGITPKDMGIWFDSADWERIVRFGWTDTCGWRITGWIDRKGEWSLEKHKRGRTR